MAPVFLGHYDAAWLASAGPDAPLIEPDDLALISQPTDYLGLNLYWGDFVRMGPAGHPEVVPFPRQYPSGDMPWLHITPQVIYWAIRLAHEVFSVPTFLITENGAAFQDEITPEGEILDLDRREYLRLHLTEVLRAITSGFDVRGYFLWSLLDNFEWAEGYAKRFGIVHVDHSTQTRLPKLGARWYSEVAKENRIL